MNTNITRKWATGAAKSFIVLILLVVFLLVFGPFKIVSVGHESAPTLFGKTRGTSYGPGFHLVNPLYGWTSYDVREKTYKDTIPIPSQDQSL